MLHDLQRMTQQGFIEVKIDKYTVFGALDLVAQIN